MDHADDTQGWHPEVLLSDRHKSAKEETRLRSPQLTTESAGVPRGCHHGIKGTEDPARSCGACLSRDQSC